ncbi:glycine, alanine and asparagine-rich protein-like [Drosophila rhopaloa]|uniref:Glycine, alanine and asparagine-rich protein-like n=1 Tax=Drosophila rhopaloa TaxID=1041015 RepID=A0A6P4EKT8_DRORH|nr:glycine, alanine and asparagine-rich protein-like [Drosophila rhopaloa]
MPGPKALLTVLLLLHAFPRLESFHYRPAQPNAKHCLSSLYGDSGGGGSGGGSGGGNTGCAEANSKKDCNSSGFGRGDSKAKASNIAQKAALEAKAASDSQMAAAEAAASQVKSELAAKAAQSARAAEAALAGKQQIVEQLQQEMTEADAVVSEVTSSLQNTQANANAAASAAHEAQTQLNQLKNLVIAATANMANIENVASGAQQELAEKTQLLEAAKHRVENLARQMNDAKSDFEKTKQAAYKAACAAVEAKQKAQRARRMINHHQQMRWAPRMLANKLAGGGVKM